MAMAMLYTAMQPVTEAMVSLEALLPAGPRKDFPPAAAALEAPEWQQLLIAAGLFVAFAAAITSGDEAKTARARLELIRPSALALRFATFAAALGLAGLLQDFAQPLFLLAASPAKAFPPPGSQLEASVQTQVLLLLALFLVFAGAVAESFQSEASQTQTHEEKKTVAGDQNTCRQELLKASAALFCSFITVGLVAALTGAWDSVTTGPREGFPPAGAMLEIPQWQQLLILSSMFLVFATLVASSESDTESESQEQVTTAVSLVRAHAIARRFAVALGLVGLAGFLRAWGVSLPGMPYLPGSVSHVLSLASLANANAMAFPSQASALVVEVPACVQFLLASSLCLVFAAAIGDDDFQYAGSTKDGSSKDSTTTTTQLAALLLAVAMGLLGALSAAGVTAPDDLAWEQLRNGALLLLGTLLVFSDSRLRPMLNPGAKRND